MGSDCHVVVTGESSRLLAPDAERLVRELEDRWTRFRPSELTAVNDGAGRPVRVSPETVDVVARAVDAWRVTGGAFDPTVSVAALGYDRSYELVGDRATAPAGRPAPGCAGVVADPTGGTVTVPDGVALDLGGIGKGWAADLVAETLVAAGADGACVNVGGDVRVAGAGPDGDWPVAVEPLPGWPSRVLLVGAGGVATSSPRGKTWAAGGTPMHHIVDPRTGLPARSDVVAATVVAGEAWWAEVLATYALLRGSATALARIPALGGEALLHTTDGVVTTAGLAAYLPVVTG